MNNIKGSMKMHCKNILLWNYQIYKHFCTCNTMLNAGREARFINKVLLREKNNIYTYNHKKSGYIDNYSDCIGKNRRRNSMLNKLFMKNVTDHMGSIEFSEELREKGFEITDVYINGNYSMLKVFWIGNKDFDRIHDILQKSARILRNELSQIRVLGNVPKIQFIRNINHYNTKLVDDIFKTINSVISEENEAINNTNQNENESINDEENIYNIKLPEKTQDIFNLNHNKMINKISKQIKRPSIIQIIPNECEEKITDDNVTTNISIDESTKELNENSKMLSTFLKKRVLDIRRKEISSLENFKAAKAHEEELENISNQEKKYTEEDRITEINYQIQNFRTTK